MAAFSVVKEETPIFFGWFLKTRYNIRYYHNITFRTRLKHKMFAKNVCQMLNHAHTLANRQVIDSEKMLELNKLEEQLKQLREILE